MHEVLERVMGQPLPLESVSCILRVVRHTQILVTSSSHRVHQLELPEHLCALPVQLIDLDSHGGVGRSSGDQDRAKQSFVVDERVEAP